MFPKEQQNGRHTPFSLQSGRARTRTHARYSSSYNRNRKPATANRRRKLWRLFPLFLCVYICVWKRASVTNAVHTGTKYSITISLVGSTRRPLKFIYMRRFINLWLNNHKGQLHTDPRQRPWENSVDSLSTVSRATQSAHDSKNNSVVSFKPSGISLLTPKCIH